MLNEERKAIILQAVADAGSASVQELMLLLDASESTIRRDLTELDRRHQLIKVHGGAMAIGDAGTAVTTDVNVSERQELNQESKQAIARYAASLIQEDDVVFLDAGTTTGYMLDYLTCRNTLFVTNAISHARRLCTMGMNVCMPGGVLKASTEALIGAVTCQTLEKYHFTKSFLGTNGITRREGCTTPDAEEAAVKEMVASHCRDCFVLADNTKFGRISTVTFADYQKVTFISDPALGKEWTRDDNVLITE